MAQKAENKDIELVSKVIVEGEDSLKPEEKIALKQALSKRTNLEDVMHLLGLYYPELTKEELDTVMSRMYSQQPETKEEAAIMNRAAHKHPSTLDIINLLKTFSAKSVMPRIADMQDEILTMQIIIHDYMVSKSELKKLVSRLYDEYNKKFPAEKDNTDAKQGTTGNVEDSVSGDAIAKREFIDNAYKKIVTSKMVMTRQDYADALTTKKKKLEEAAKRANEALKMTAEATKKIKHG